MHFPAKAEGRNWLIPDTKCLHFPYKGCGWVRPQGELGFAREACTVVSSVKFIVRTPKIPLSQICPLVLFLFAQKMNYEKRTRTSYMKKILNN